SPSTHKMSPWVKKFFLDFMPRVLCMKRPDYHPRYAYEGDFSTMATATTDYGMNFPTGTLRRDSYYDSSPRTESSVDHS
ncbi:unnamed protein product, partial [Allacma fusca]